MVFQSLIGTGKTRYGDPVFLLEGEFQSLIGTGKTLLRLEEREREHQVSIPHRYGQNTVTVKEPSSEQRVFQSLIGTGKTRQLHRRARAADCFNPS